jgi:Holliday junction DNA helicase RuvA
MIGRLHGLLVYKQPPGLMIDIQGVGYELEASLSTFAKLPEVGSEITLYTHLAVREDAHTLYGFANLEERALFRSLIKVSGIGAKLALLILSGMNGEAFSRCVRDGDTASLTNLPGIGKKTAERLIMEMRDRIGELNLGPGRVLNVDSTVSSPPFNAVDDAISALVALGYKAVDASRMIQAVAQEGLDSEALIRLALQSAVRK